MPASAESIYEQLCAYVRETTLLSSLAELAGWDERTYLPSAAGPYRAEQLALLAGMIHQRRTAPQLGDWLAQLTDSPLSEDLHSDTGTTIRRLRREFNKEIRLPSELVRQLARATVLGQQAWVRARDANDFLQFAPRLQEIVQLKREQADALGYTTCRYDALLDEYEPEATTADIAHVLSDLRAELVPLVTAIGQSGCQPRQDILRRNYPPADQAEFGKRAAARIGFDFQRGRLDVTHHPFCASLGPHDCRITTRYDAHYLPGALFGILHEAGHGLYDQGQRSELFGLPPGSYVSLGIHESQSRLWENLVGRSRPLWQFLFPLAQQVFPTALADVELDDFYFAINQVQPSFIRVEADEATYNLHIIVRFELEQALLDGQLDVEQLPDAWNAKYRKYLGIEPPDSALGVLQDIHWSAGLIGYFPTYALGNLYAAQFYQQACQDLPSLQQDLAAGEFAGLLAWLRERIHTLGQCYSAPELLARITGRPLSHAPLIEHLKAKLGPLYQLH